LVTVQNLVSGAHNCPDDSNAFTLTVETTPESTVKDQ
jgi:hypothetical protein